MDGCWHIGCTQQDVGDMEPVDESSMDKASSSKLSTQEVKELVMLGLKSGPVDSMFRHFESKMRISDLEVETLRMRSHKPVMQGIYLAKA